MKQLTKKLLFAILTISIMAPAIYTFGVNVTDEMPPERYSVLLLLDSSGSMSGDRGDLRYKRNTAAQVLVDILPENSYFGFMYFDSEIRNNHSFERITVENRDSLKQELTHLELPRMENGRLTGAGYRTNYENVLPSAFANLLNISRQIDTQPILIVLTDGDGNDNVAMHQDAYNAFNNGYSAFEDQGLPSPQSFIVYIKNESTLATDIKALDRIFTLGGAFEEDDGKKPSHIQNIRTDSNRLIDDSGIPIDLSDVTCAIIDTEANMLPAAFADVFYQVNNERVIYIDGSERFVIADEIDIETIKFLLVGNGENPIEQESILETKLNRGGSNDSLDLGALFDIQSIGVDNAYMIIMSPPKNRKTLNGAWSVIWPDTVVSVYGYGIKPFVIPQTPLPTPKPAENESISSTPRNTTQDKDFDISSVEPETSVNSTLAWNQLSLYRLLGLGVVVVGGILINRTRKRPRKTNYNGFEDHRLNDQGAYSNKQVNSGDEEALREALNKKVSAEDDRRKMLKERIESVKKLSRKNNIEININGQPYRFSFFSDKNTAKQGFFEFGRIKKDGDFFIEVAEDEYEEYSPLEETLENYFILFEEKNKAFLYSKTAFALAEEYETSRKKYMPFELSKQLTTDLYYNIFESAKLILKFRVLSR